MDMELHVGRSVDDGCVGELGDVVEISIEDDHCIGSGSGLSNGQLGKEGRCRLNR